MANTKSNKDSKKQEKRKEWIKKAINNPGSFTGKAKKKGITTAQLQTKVEKNPDKYDEKTRKQAQLRETLVRLNKRNKGKG